MWEYAKKFVLREIPVEDALDQLEGIYTSFTGPDVVPNHFDVLYSILVNFKDVTDNDRNLLVKLMYRSISLLLEHLETLLGDVNNYAIQDLDERKRECKQLKLNIFVFCTLIDYLEKKSTDTVVEIAGKGKGNKKKKEQTTEWDKCRDKSVYILSKIFTLTLQWLFNPQVVEEDFVIYVMNISWKLFENATNKNKEVINSTTIIFGTGIERYKQAFNFKTAVVNLLQNKESLGNNIVTLVDIITKDYHQNQLIADICEEIYEIDKQLLMKNAIGPKALSQFMIDLAEKCPKQFVSAVPSLLLLLDDEPYQLRNGALSAMGSILLSELSEENMSEEKKIIRNQLLDKLEDHIYDVTSFTRGKAVSVWKRLCEFSKIPLSRIDRVVELIVERLMDKASYVRKQSIQFLTVFIEVNQYTLKLSNELLQEIFEKEKAKLHAIVRPKRQKKSIDQNNTSKRKSSQDEQTGSEENNENSEKEEENDENEPKRVKKENGEQEEEEEEMETEENKENLDDTIIDEDFAPKMDLLNKKSSDNNGQADDNDLLSYDKQRCVVKYLENCIKISEQIKIALPRVFCMLYSKSLTDIQEAIDFFVTASEYDVHGSVDGIRKMLGLIFCSEKSVRDALKKAYIRIYMDSSIYNNLSLRHKALMVAKRLTILVQDATVGEIASLEELLSQLMQENKIESKLIQVLWERFTKTIPNTTDEESRIAIHLISMLACAESVIVRQNLDTIMEHGLKESEQIDFYLVQNCCKALERVIEDRGKIDTKKTPFKLPTDHPLFIRLSELVLNHVCDYNEEGYVPMCCHIIKVIYLLSEHPNRIAENLLRNLLKVITDRTESLFDDENQQSKKMINSELLSRFFYILGEIAQNVMLFIEIDVSTEIKKRNQLKSQKQECKTPSRRKTISKQNDDDGDLAEEMGLTGAAADEETEFLNHICNHEIVYKSNKVCNFLAEFSPMITAIASDPIKYSDLHLQTAVCVCLSKFMLVSEKFCTNHLRLLFTILEKTSEPKIKINTNICCGDLCIRAPNLLDAWTPKLYLSLRSTNLNVRRAAFKVISRLILADMVKVKEQISEIAKVIVDSDSNLSNMSKIFFVDLAKKNNNAIYNILPDVISHLSNEKVGVNEENFQMVVKHLFELIEKERQTICLTEKLCQRFKIAENETEWSALSYCLTLLQISDKSVAKICENIHAFSDKLVEDRVYENFVTLIANIKKTTGLKQPTKEMLDEFEKKIEEFRNKGLEKQATKTSEQIEEEMKEENEDNNEKNAESNDVEQTATATSEDDEDEPVT